MHRHSIVLALGLVLALGIFFQYNRTDGFVSLLKNHNTVLAMGELKAPPAENIPSAEQYLLVYDNTDINSILLKRNIEQVLKYQKKKITIVDSSTVIDPQSFNGVILALDNFDQIQSLAAFREFVKQGGSVYIMMAPRMGNTLSEMHREMGFDNIGGSGLASGLKLISNVLIQGKGFELGAEHSQTSLLTGSVNAAATVHIASLDDTPILWEYRHGQGKYIVYRASGLQEKGQRGIVTGVLSLGRQSYIYPIIATKTVYIDDFPSPAPDDYAGVITKDYQLSTADFYRLVWWPDMLKLAERYDLRYTGMIIESYNDRTSPPFSAEEDNDGNNKKNLVVYGRELLKGRGELGVHGYNHQPLVTAAYTGAEIELGYQPWSSVQAMVQSIAEVKRYVAEVYPEYKLRVYVPPSNIISKEGRQALLQANSDFNIIASLYIANLSDQERSTYVQEFERSKDGIYEMPRVSYDYMRSNASDWDILNAICSLGVFSHFVHPDNFLYEDRAMELGWPAMYREFSSLMKQIHDKYGWLRSATASEAASYLDDFLNLEYRLIERSDGLSIVCWNFRNEAYFVLRTNRKITSVQGAHLEKIDDNVYLLKINSSEVNVLFESEEIL